MGTTNKGTDGWHCGFVLAAFMIILIMCVAAFIIFKSIDSWDHRGQFGDLFGVVNALFSGLAFAGIIITIRQQHQDLSYQREALEQTREEMRQQTIEFDKQNETLKIQRFENTLFKMLEVQQSIVNDLYSKDMHKDWMKENKVDQAGIGSKEVLIQDDYHGRNLFYYVFMICKHNIRNVNGRQKRVEGLYNVIEETGKAHFDDYFTTSMFDHYFRHLYTILKFISNNDWLDEYKKYQYATFVRATLSRYELVLLYYNGFFHPKMKKMLERYCLLNNLRPFLLPISLEYHKYLDGLKITYTDLSEAGFSVSDYEFYMTDKEDENDKYHLSAFFTQEEMQKGIGLLNHWREFINSKVKIEN